MGEIQGLHFANVGQNVSLFKRFICHEHFFFKINSFSISSFDVNTNQIPQILCVPFLNKIRELKLQGVKFAKDHTLELFQALYQT